MAQAAAAKGVNIKVVSGFRTMAEQTYLYNCYIHCNCNNCNLAASPGNSNHQSGHALDLNTSASGVLSWLNAHGGTYGFKRTVASEAWHWEWWGGGPGGGPCVDKPTYPLLTIKASAVTIAGQDRDLCQLGSSKGVFDLWKDQDVEVDIDVKNSGTAVGRNVTIGVWAEEPSLTVAHWNILSDWKANGAFKANDTDGVQKIGHDNPGQTFNLNLGSVSPDETKRAKLVVRGGKLSYGAAGHPEIRAWVAHVDDVYEKKDYADAPKNVESYQKQNGGDLKAAFQAEVLDMEQCDGKDNDCNGEIDDGLSCESTEGPEPLPDSGPSPATPGSSTPQAQEDGTVGGCSVASTTPATRLPLLVLGALLLAVSFRRRR
jgi:MYXO-CTERM domain-containing protein